MARTVRGQTWVFFVALALLATDAGAQTVVVGRGNGYLRGAFSLHQAPVDSRTILVTTSATILGRPDAKGNMTSISGGMIPFRIMAPGATVTLEGLRFVAPTAAAIDVVSAGGLR